MKFLQSLRAQLFFWYIGSLLLVVGYFLLFIHFYTIPHALAILVALFLLLAGIQFLIIYRITRSLVYLSSRIKKISSKNLEEKILDIKSKNEIGELAISFNNLLDRLDEAFKREQQFIGDVAHELKTPLATMRSSLEIALNRPRSNDEYRLLLKDVIEETDSLTETVKNVLDLAWSEASQENKKPVRFNLSQVVDDLTEIAQKMGEGKKISVFSETIPDVYVLGFKEKLARAILNIIDNAIKYTPERGQINIRLEKNFDKTFLTIEDTGVGIAEKEIPNIFDRFYRGAKTEKVLGSGLGLAISKSIVNLHRGDIKVKSKTGQGSTFIIILPII